MLDAHGVARADVVGWGLGALVALQLAAHRPARVERLVLLGGAAHGAPLLARAPTVAALCGVGEAASAEEHLLGLLDRLVSPAWRPFAEMFLPQLLPRPGATLAALRGQWAMLADYDLRPRLAHVRVPTLILVGAEDRLTPPALAERLRAEIPDAELRLIAGAGHAAHWEAPAAVLAAVEPFLCGAASVRAPAGSERTR
jgi:pimeloyl-ACP methyl ester carboxylesterase